EARPGQRQQTHESLRRHPLGPAELQRVRSESLTHRPAGRAARGQRFHLEHPPMTSSRMAAQSRRDFLRFAAAGAALTSTSGWLDLLAAHAASAGVKHKSCILLWMEGGPSQKDTFDMKPGTKDAGEFRPIKTSVPGIEISEHFPKLARHMKHAAVLRSL